MRQVRIAATARRDLTEIWKFIARDNPAAANRVRDGIKARFELLARFPGIGQKRNELADGLHCFPVGNYVIYYIHSIDHLRILRIVHGARDAARLF